MDSIGKGTMNPTFKLLQNDQEELKKLDEEFLAAYTAGTLPQYDSQPLDPQSDPFGQGFAWLHAPLPPYEAAIEKLSELNRDAWYQVGGVDLRAAVLKGLLAAGTDEQVYRAWAQSRFLAICFSDGEYGQDILNRVQSDEPITPDLIYCVATTLEADSELARLSHQQRVAAALIAIEAVRQNSNPS
jgi:hypothetical protein